YAPGASLRTGTCSSVYCHSNGVASEAGSTGPGGIYAPADIGNVADETNVYSNLPWDAGANSVGCSGQGRTYTCHNGDILGNVLGNSAVYPPTGDHGRNAHSNDNPCWWCHNLERDGAFTGQGLNYQGTYGTGYHVDAALWFDPHGTPTGGTMYDIALDQNGYEDGHCGSGQTCWY
ncbi:MAG: CxxxxCH/CxxCH domain-containing protein, partial [Thermoplasmata archaeon]|nr:CxxxxCH/CxxCH domain-containing protein [Thermoplasmata archaeon]